MAKKNTSLFLRYFYDFFIIIVSFSIIITFFLSYFIFSTKNTATRLYRTKATEQVNQLIGDVLASCTNIFASSSSDIYIENFEHTDIRKLSEIDRYNMVLQLKSNLTNRITNNNYIHSIYLCSPKQGYVLSHLNFKMTDDFSSFVWYNKDLISSSDPVPFTVSRILPKDGDTEYIAMYKTLDPAYPDSNICIIVLDSSALKNKISEIFYDNDCSFFVWDNSDNSPIINIGLDENNLKEIHECGLKKNSPSFFTSSQSCSIFALDDYNWDCAYVYDNTTRNRAIIKSLVFYIPLSLLVLLSVAALISYLRAKRSYLPINNMISELRKQKNNINLQDIVFDYQYTELNYITEMLCETIQDRQKLQEELAANLKKLNEANKYALEVQIQPHFIFNTLEIIYLEAYEIFGDRNIISEMIYNLSDILRVTLRNDNKFIPISSEFDYIKKYIFIQNIRFENTFDTIYDMDENSENLVTPKLILQPIVENAIVHGIIPAKRKCTLKISNRVEKDRVVFTIEDDGTGMSSEKLEQIRENLKDALHLPKKNIGIANVNMRINLLFGKDYGCRVVSSNEHGSKFEILIPVIYS